MSQVGEILLNSTPFSGDLVSLFTSSSMLIPIMLVGISGFETTGLKRDRISPPLKQENG